MEMIEKIARAIWEARRFTASCDDVELEDWGDGTIPRMNGVFDEAMAALKAMREPSNEMTVVGWKEADKRDAILGNGEVAIIWRAMIDAAIEEAA